MANEMNSKVLDRRIKAVEVVGKMAAKRDASVTRDYPTLMKEFFARFGDVNASVRAACVQVGSCLLKHNSPSSAVYKEALDHLLTHSQDLEANVREIMIASVIKLLKKEQYARQVPGKLILAIIERLRDKKVNVRRTSIKELAWLWREYCSGICDSQLFDQIDSRFVTIPSELISALKSIPTQEDQLLIEDIFDEYILGAEADDSKSVASSQPLHLKYIHQIYLLLIIDLLVLVYFLMPILILTELLQIDYLFDQIIVNHIFLNNILSITTPIL
jgi:hypothetical protein